MLDEVSCFSRAREPSLRLRSDEPRGLSLRPTVEGRMSFFCFEAGRISSRSTGTPRETRNRRRIRERTQLGGWRGGGATSWAQREAERGVRNMGLGVSERVGVGWEE